MPDIQYKTASIDSVKIFYREAGSPSLPGLLLLHGHASASHTFRNILPDLASSFHVIAPDYPGFGQSDRPKDYKYTFENVSNTIDKLTEVIGLTKYYIYVFDFGGKYQNKYLISCRSTRLTNRLAPVGFPLATKHPERILGIFTQSGNAYVEGISPKVSKDFAALWENPYDQAAIDGVKHLIAPEGITEVYTHQVQKASSISPDAAALDSYYTTRPGAQEIQLDLLRDYQTVPGEYPKWQAYMREYKPKTVAVWGKHDPFFIPPGAHAFKNDNPNADITILEGASHFLNESHPEEIVKGLKKLL